MRTLWFLLVVTPILMAQNFTPSAYTPEYFLQFGNYLFENRDYERAATELERFLFIQPTDTFPRIHFRVGVAYYRLHTYSRAKHHFQKALQLIPTASSFRDSVKLGLAAISLRTEKTPQLSSVLPPVDSLDWHGMSLKYRLYYALAALKTQHYQQAQAVLPRDTSNITSDVRYGFFRVNKLVKKATHLPQKSPWKAALLSSLIPGAGKFYTQQAGDGLYTFLLVVGSSLLSYRGTRRGDAFQTYFFGSAALFFYAGNIYGSFLSAKMYNQRIKDQLNEEIEQEIQYWTRF